MKYEIVNTAEFKIIGIEYKLNLTDETSSTKIGNLWNKFFAQKMSSKIVDVIKPLKTMGLYTHYDRKGNYTLIIGCVVNSLYIPAAKYALFIIKGQTPQAVSDFWQELWLHKDSLGFKRAFTHDFEMYDQRLISDNPEFDVYIAVSE
jgi:predicted transcriptional regulator YdeE